MLQQVYGGPIAQVTTFHRSAWPDPDKRRMVEAMVPQGTRLSCPLPKRENRFGNGDVEWSPTFKAGGVLLLKGQQGGKECEPLGCGSNTPPSMMDTLLLP